ncbi:helix-turn-helix domain-containing protein [Pokkaliibacter sp. CJK22405]|uniref:helix-turn-helix domain-containing protein n=1 Tax=Pokkaliibacter sp. CJK22405 TaxID=3384615 RepID=UPI003984BAED
MRQQRMTVKRLADLMDVAHSTVSGWRQGRTMRLWQVVATCHILECSTDWLLWGEAFEVSTEERKLLKKWRAIPAMNRRAFLQLFTDLY